MYRIEGIESAMVERNLHPGTVEDNVNLEPEGDEGLCDSGYWIKQKSVVTVIHDHGKLFYILIRTAQAITSPLTINVKYSMIKNLHKITFNLRTRVFELTQHTSSSESIFTSLCTRRIS